MNPRREAGDIQELDLEFLDVGQCRKLTQDTTAEVIRRELALYHTGLELLDQGKQAKHVHIQDGSGPPGLWFGQVFDSSGEGVIEMGNSGDVPGATDPGARAETACVVSKIGDDYFEDLQGKPGGRRTVCC